MNTIKVYEVGKVLDAFTSPKEQQNIKDLIEKNNNILLDFSHCTYISSAGLRVLLISYKFAKAKGGQIVFAKVSDEIRDIMKITGFDKFFKFYNTVEECIDAQTF